MPLFGSHLSIAGGYYKAVDTAAELGLQTVQLFTKNNNQWAGKPLSDEDVRLFREAVQRTGIQRPCAHDSYLINLASPDDVLWKKSVDALVIELERAESLGLEGVVMHPGSFVSSSEEAGQQRIIDGLNEAHHRTAGIRCQYWLETTARISAIDSSRLAICWKTFAIQNDLGSVSIPVTSLQRDIRCRPRKSTQRRWTSLTGKSASA